MADPVMDPRMAGKMATAQIQMPRESAQAKIAAMNWLERMVQPGAIALTWPWGRVAIAEDRLKDSGMDAGDVMAHELTHIKQLERNGAMRTVLRSLLSPQKDYLARPEEQEAFEAEVRRPVRRADIQLK